MAAAEMVEQYLAAGLPVLPLHTMRGGRCTCRNPECHSPAKHPLTAHGKDDAATDPDTVAGWLARWPGCNWGVRPPVGVVVLDVDPRNDGDLELAKLQQAHGRVPNTLTALTGSGGVHYWLMHNGPTRGKLCTGVDVKSHSGYLVAPPSLHVSGGRYEWTNQAPAAPAPRWVRTILNPPVTRRAPATGCGSLDPLIRFITASPPGEINNQFFWACCRALDAGLDLDVLIDAALALGRPEHRVRGTAQSAINTPRKQMAGAR